MKIYKINPKPKSENCADCGEKMQNEPLHSIFCQKKGKITSPKCRMEVLAEMIGSDLEKQISKNNAELIENGKKLREILL